MGEVRVGPPLTCVSIRLMLGCKCRFSELPVLTYRKYAALRFPENQHFRSSLS
jgi:hypothetical protein